MTTQLAAADTSGSIILFPIPMSGTVPAIGQGFDLVGGSLLPEIALNPPTAEQLLMAKKPASQGKYFYIRDSKSFSDVFSFSLSAGGGGWGASYGMTADASALLKTNSLTQTIHYRGVTTATQSTVRPNVALSAEAGKVLSQGVGSFNDRYGTHFVAGYIYGKSCNLSYHLIFSTLYLATNFSAKYNESEITPEFGDHLQTSISNALTTSNSSCQFSVSHDLRGFKTIAPQNMADLAKVMAAYSASSDDQPSPIFVIVYPWTYLDAVNSKLGGLTLNDSLRQLANLMDKLTYIAEVCEGFIGSSLYTGVSQLQAVSDVGKSARTEIAQIVALLNQRNTSGKPLTQHDVDAFTSAEDLQEKMNVALSRFRLAFSVSQPNNTLTLSSEMKDENIPSSVADHIISAPGGVWFDWSFANSEGWQGTAGKRAELHSFCGDSNASMNIVLNSDDGTVQAWLCQYGVRLSSNVFSVPKAIRGSANSKGLKDPDNAAVLAWPVPNTPIEIWVSPI